MSQADIKYGNVCRNEEGQVGVVESINYPCGTATCHPHYFGTTVDGGYWQGMDIRVLAESWEEYQEQT